MDINKRGFAVMTVAALRGMTDEQLIEEHDKNWNVAEGGGFYLDELRRRDAVRAETASYALARRVYWLTWANGVFAGVAAVAALIALFIHC